MGSELRDQLQVGHRWDQSPSRPVDHLFNHPLHPVLLDSDHVPGQGIHDFIPFP